MSEPKKLSPVYCSWVTMQNALDQLAKAPPSHLDRSAFPGIAWTVQSQLLTGLRFLGLIDETAKTSTELIELAEDTDRRKQNWEKLLRHRYEFIFSNVDLSTATPKQLEDAMAAYGTGSGDTQAKALRFFLSAAEYAGIKLSPYLNKTRKVSPLKKRRSVMRRAHAESNAQRSTPTSSQPTGLTVELKSGGSLSLAATVDLFSMSTEDRTFVFKLIDDLRHYDSGKGHPA